MVDLKFKQKDFTFSHLKKLSILNQNKFFFLITELSVGMKQ